MAIRCKARWSWRFPVRLRRWRTVWLDQTGNEAEPLWRANAALERKRPMPAVSPMSLAAVSGPQPTKVSSDGARSATRWAGICEGRRRDHACRIVDRADEGQPRSPPLEPVVAAAVELEEETFGRHPLTPTAMARRATPTRAGQARPAQDALQARPTDLDALPFGQQLGQVRVVDVGIGGPTEIDDLGPERSVQPAPGWSAAIAMDEPGRTSALEGDPEAPQLALRQPDQVGCFGHRQLTLQDACQDPDSSLLSRGHRDRRLHSWRLTNSLSSWP